MEKRKVDVAIIGAGTAGMAAYRQASRHIDNVLLIEGGEYGTTCARVGCMPSKLLIAAADAAHAVHGADLFGINAESIKVDGKAVMERVRRERDRFVSFVLEAVEDFPEAHKLRGQVRFKSRNTLVVDDQVEVTADRIVIATGSRPNIPGFLEAAGDRLIVNDDLFELTDLPDSVAVFGPGVIGLELGQALSRLGVKVRMFGVGGALGPIQDDSIRKYALKTFNDEFYLDPDADVTSVARVDEGVQITYKHVEKGETTETFDYLLAATGRRSNIDKLAIEASELELDDDNIPVFDPFTLQCGTSPVFIAGDVNDEVPLLHEAADEGHIAGRNAAVYPDIRAGKRRAPLSILFTEPQIATVGRTINEVDDYCRGCYAVGEVSFEGQGRSRVIGKNQGILRVYGEQGTGQFLGAEMFGPSAEHLGHLLAWAVQKHMTVSEMLEMPFYHPVIEEGLRTALRDLNHKLLIGPEMIENCLDCGPGG